MLDKILIILIFLTIVLFVLKVKVWKKRYFVKELYVSEGASIAICVVTIVNTIGLLIINYILDLRMCYIPCSFELQHTAFIVSVLFQVFKLFRKKIQNLVHFSLYIIE